VLSNVTYANGPSAPSYSATAQCPTACGETASIVPATGCVDQDGNPADPSLCPSTVSCPATSACICNTPEIPTYYTPPWQPWACEWQVYCPYSGNDPCQNGGQVYYCECGQVLWSQCDDGTHSDYYIAFEGANFPGIFPYVAVPGACAGMQLEQVHFYNTPPSSCSEGYHYNDPPAYGGCFTDQLTNP
jgi:hypothetical protein